jgi:hypothetical protein
MAKFLGLRGAPPDTAPHLLLATIAVGCSAAVLAECEIGVVLVHPPFAESYSCSEHYVGQFKYLGDALGTDCTIGRLVEENGRKWMRFYESDGSKNEDWFGWGADVLSPCDCTVVDVRINPKSTEPGILGEPPASAITFLREDGTKLSYAHIADPKVEEGDSVAEGQPVAVVGNNGYSRQLHIHIAAWREETPLQIRFDQRKMGPRTE